MAYSNTQLSLDAPENIEDEELKITPKVKFHLHGAAFPDNKIYGTIDIEPKQAWKFIKEFSLIIDNVLKKTFRTQSPEISVSGFTPSKKPMSIAIEVEFVWKNGAKKVPSKPHSFYFLNYVYTLSPVVSFEWSSANTNKEQKPIAVIKWSHIGDQKAHEYFLYLNERKIYHVRYKQISKKFEICITELKPNEKYTLQIVAMLLNGKETCRSDPVEFIVPTEPNEAGNDILTVQNETLPYDLPRYVKEEPEEAKEESEEAKEKQEEPNEIKTAAAELNAKIDSYSTSQHPSVQLEWNVKRLLDILTRQIEGRSNHYQTLQCHHLPHQNFLGIEHYFNDNGDMIDKLSSDFQNNRRISITMAPKTSLTNEKHSEKESSVKHK